MKSKIKGFVYGFAIGDALGMPIVGMENLYLLREKYPLFNYIDAVTDRYMGFKAGQLTYVTQFFTFMLTVIMKYRNSPSFGKIFEKAFRKECMNKTFVSGDSWFYEMLAMMESDRNVLKYTTTDHRSFVPFLYLFPYVLFNDKFMNFYNYQNNRFLIKPTTFKYQRVCYFIFKQLMNKSYSRDVIKSLADWYKNYDACYISIMLYEVLDCLSTTDSFNGAMVKAINNIYRTHTNELGAIVGAITGYAYGFKNIPKHLIAGLKENNLNEISNNLYDILNVKSQ